MAKHCPYCTPENEELGNGPIKDIISIPIVINKTTVESVMPYVWLEDNRAVLDFTLFEKLYKAKINYCPMCGRNLNKYIKELKEKGVK